MQCDICEGVKRSFKGFVLRTQIHLYSRPSVEPDSRLCCVCTDCHGDWSHKHGKNCKHHSARFNQHEDARDIIIPEGMNVDYFMLLPDGSVQPFVTHAGTSNEVEMTMHTNPIAIKEEAHDVYNDMVEDFANRIEKDFVKDVVSTLERKFMNMLKIRNERSNEHAPVKTYFKSNSDKT